MTFKVQSLALLSNEARQAVTVALDSLVRWREEIIAANERWLAKVLDQVTDAHRALGSPEQVARAAKENLRQASKIQSHMIDQVMDEWQQQLKTQYARSGFPGFIFQAPVASQFTIPASEMMRFSEMTLTHIKLWIEAAETWQRTWMTAMSGGAPSSIAGASSSQAVEASTRESRQIRS
jgi:hypothetical protein